MGFSIGRKLRYRLVAIDVRSATDWVSSSLAYVGAKKTLVAKLRELESHEQVFLR